MVFEFDEFGTVRCVFCDKRQEYRYRPGIDPDELRARVAMQMFYSGWGQMDIKRTRIRGEEPQGVDLPGWVCPKCAEKIEGFFKSANRSPGRPADVGGPY